MSVLTHNKSLTVVKRAGQLSLRVDRRVQSGQGERGVLAPPTRPAEPE